MVKATFEFKCCVQGCESEHQETHEINPQYPLFPCTPYGWHRYDEDYICDKHHLGIINEIK